MGLTKSYCGRNCIAAVAYSSFHEDFVSGLRKKETQHYRKFTFLMMLITTCSFGVGNKNYLCHEAIFFSDLSEYFPSPFLPLHSYASFAFVRVVDPFVFFDERQRKCIWWFCSVRCSVWQKLLPILSSVWQQQNILQCSSGVSCKLGMVFNDWSCFTGYSRY